MGSRERSRSLAIYSLSLSIKHFLPTPPIARASTQPTIWVPSRRTKTALVVEEA
nr:MAG TPA: hypothetical protein [Caudoviricetes sp.]